MGGLYRRQTPIKKEDVPKLKNFLAQIEKDPNVAPFLEPVDWKSKRIFYRF